MTDQELRDYAADHISYELTMLHETAMRLKCDKSIDTDLILKNAFIESFTIHARALAQFLYETPKRTGDVTAEAYVKDVAAWKAARGQISAELKEVIDRTGKEIAHLTTRRFPAGDPRKVWSFEHVFTMFFEPLHLFVKYAESARLDTSVSFFIAQLPTPAAPTPGAVVFGTTSPTISTTYGGRTDVSTP